MMFSFNNVSTLPFAILGGNFRLGDGLVIAGNSVRRAEMASGKTTNRIVHSLDANAGKGFLWDNSLKGFEPNVQNLASCLHPAVSHGWLADALSRIADCPVCKLDKLLPWGWAAQTLTIAT
jgi:hypothetical protein